MLLVPSKPFLIAGALAWSGLVAAMVSASHEPTPAIAEFKRLIPSPAFDERWDNTTVEDQALLKKQDRLVMREQDPLPKHPDSVVVPPVKMPAVVMVQTEDDDKPISRRKHRSRDVCAKHGMHKVTIRGGRSWRCRK
jgi:hypothetical protein